MRNRWLTLENPLECFQRYRKFNLVAVHKYRKESVEVLQDKLWSIFLQSDPRSCNKKKNFT